MVRINEIGVKEKLIDCTVKSIANNVRTLTNAKGEKTEFRIATAEIEYPDKTKAVVGCSLWEKSLKANEDAFKVGANAQLAVQLEGDFAGYSKLQLPAMTRVDVAKLGITPGILDSVNETNPVNVEA